MVHNRLVSEVKGVGPALKEKFAELGIETVEDLMTTYPSRYENFEVLPITELVHEQKATIEGIVLSEPVVSFFGRKKSRLVVPIQVDQVVVKGVMFNRAFAKKQLAVGEKVTVTGKWDQHRQQITISHYKVGEKSTGEIEPVYFCDKSSHHSNLKKLLNKRLNNFVSK